jgi:hypothetical protein
LRLKVEEGKNAVLTGPEYGGPQILSLEQAGYTEGLGAGKCKAYCQGQFDGRKWKDVLWGTYPNFCGI